MTTLRLLLMHLYAPDAYIHFGWALLAVLTLLLGAALYFSRRRRRWLLWPLAVVLLMAWHVFLWGTYMGFRHIEVVHVDFESADLPAAFDGYRIVQLSDLHVGTYGGGREDILRRAVDSVNALQPDLVVVTGDLQNLDPAEVEAHAGVLATIKARDGVVSVKGNHDYPMYMHGLSVRDAELYDERVAAVQRRLGWHLLLNASLRVSRDSASIIIAGMENDGEGRFPARGDITMTLYGVSLNDFVVMLQHDPTSWRRTILPHSHAQLTLSGHTHGGQLALFGLSPAALLYDEHQGLYSQGPRALYVSRGLGGVIPFRFGATPEITVITLRRCAPLALNPQPSTLNL